MKAGKCRLLMLASVSRALGQLFLMCSCLLCYLCRATHSALQKTVVFRAAATSKARVALIGHGDCCTSVDICGTVELDLLLVSPLMCCTESDC